MTATAVKTKTAAAAAAHSYGWVPDIPDQRDIPYTAPLNTLVKLPAFVDLRDGFPTPYDQGNLGSCTANALAGLMQFVQKKEGMADFTPSRLFIYYEERKREHTITSDSGAMLRDGMKVLHTVGAPPETLWPYDITKFTVLPPAKAYATASGDEALQYKRVYRTLNQFRGCLAEGYPFTVGIG